jgi:O-acetyl-ADP-ribose deacetylase (regulator of RNase III)
MAGDVFVAHADITHLAADALVLSTASDLSGTGAAHGAFCERYKGFAQAFRDLSEADPGWWPVGETFWIPTQGHGRVRGVVVVVAVGDGTRTPSAERAEKATAAAVRRACAEVPPDPSGARRLIALPTIGFGRGGYRDRVQCARVMVEAVAAAAADRPDVDVVFCAYTDLNYQIMLHARDEAGLEPHCPIAGHPHLRGLVAALRERRCVLFVGAGLSRPAGLRDWNGLLEVLATALGLHPTGDYEWLRPLAIRLGLAGEEDFTRVAAAAAELGLRAPDRTSIDFALDLAQWYVSRFGREALADLVRREFGGTGVGDKRHVKPTLAHYYLLSLPVRLVLTTNYDDLVETTLTGLRRDPRVVVEPQEVARTALPEQPSVVKFHGDANTGLNIVLTRNDFDGFFDSHPVMASFLEGLLLNQTFLFYGYGLRDPNTRQIYSRIAHLLRGAGRAAFAVSVDAPSDTSEYYLRQWEEQGLHLLAMPGETLRQRVQSAWRFLDWLTRKTADRPEVLLAPHVPQGDMGPQARPLWELFGPALEELGKKLPAAVHDHARTNPRALARLLDLLVGLGWRPGQWEDALEGLWQRLEIPSLRTHDDAVSVLWLALAAAFGDDRGRRRHCLYQALRHSGQIATARRIRDAVRELDAPESTG